MVVTERKERLKKCTDIFEEWLAENVPDLMKDMNLHIQETQQTPTGINKEFHISTYHNQTIKSQGQTFESPKKRFIMNKATLVG